MKRTTTSRLLRWTLFVGLPLLLLAACFQLPGGPSRNLASFDVNAPAAVVVDQPFSLTIRAVGVDGSNPLTSMSGNVSLTVDGGATVTPSSLSMVSGAVTSQVTIGGAAGNVTVTAGADGKTGSDTVDVLGAGATTKLPGEPDDDVAEAVPELAFTPQADDYSTGHPELEDTYVSFNTLILTFELGTTVAQANELLTSIGAVIVGGIAGESGVVSGILILRVPTGNHGEMEVLLTDLRNDDRVENVVQDSLLEQDVVSGSNGGNPGGWTWDITPAGGNWGLELIRVPQMWNLNGALDAAGSKTVTGVFDVGFADAHADLAYLENQTPGSVADHGTHVAGIIGATFDNDAGIDGVNPFADLVVRTRDNSDFGGATVLEVRQSFGEAHLEGFADLVRSRDDIRVINISMGYNWGPAGVDQDTNATAQELVSEQGALFRTLLIILGNESELPLIITAAGNDSSSGFGEQDARWGSPFNYAALVLDPPDILGTSPIVVVESLQNDVGGTGGATRSAFSNTGAHVSAPGSSVLSTLSSTGYGTMSGTSMASPHVAGLVSYLYTLDPNLNHAQVRDLLFGNRVGVAGGASGRIDAFSTVLDIDRIRSNDEVRGMLLDADGNGHFDEADIDLFLAGFDDGATDTPPFSRFDLNGDGLTGGDTAASFDLDRNGSYEVISQSIDAEAVAFNESSLSDLMVLCYFAYSALFDGNSSGRSDALGDSCNPVAATLPDGAPVVSQVTVDLPDPTTGDVGADVMFNVDLSGSYDDDLNNFQTLAGDIVTALSASISDVRVGISSFSDAPCSGFGREADGDFGHRLDLPLTSKVDDFQDALDVLKIYSGGDGSESQLESMYQTITGSGVEVSEGDCAGVADIDPGSAGWSSERLRFLIHATDANFHRPSDFNYPYPTTVDSLIETAVASGTRIFVLDSGGGADSAKTEIAAQTSGEVFTLDSSSSQVVNAVRDAAEGAISTATIRLVASGDDAGFVDSIEPAEFVDVDLTTEDTVSFDVTFMSTVTPQPEEQVFHFSFEITVDGAVVESRPVVITIPAE